LLTIIGTTTLHYLASNEFQLHIADTFKMNQNTASNCIMRVTGAIASHSAEFISLPRGNAEIRTKEAFFNYCSIPYIIGSIDCTHCRITVR